MQKQLLLLGVIFLLVSVLFNMSDVVKSEELPGIEENSKKGVQIPDTTTVLTTSVFFDSTIDELYIPCNCLEIKYASYEKSSLQSITVDEYNPNYSSYNGILLTKDMKTLLFCPPAYDKRVVLLPSFIENVAPAAFELTQNIEILIFPQTIKEVGGFAIDNSNIRTVIFCGADTIFTMDAFNACPRLKEIWVLKDSLPEEQIITDTEYIDLTQKLRYL
ncbi:MAG: leucine-rich repeat protein [Clostridia bacterium]|nr:leucine-rich repeat protein [Clostridia bacterium]